MIGLVALKQARYSPALLSARLWRSIALVRCHDVRRACASRCNRATWHSTRCTFLTERSLQNRQCTLGSAHVRCSRFCATCCQAHLAVDVALWGVVLQRHFCADPRRSQHSVHHLSPDTVIIHIAFRCRVSRTEPESWWQLVHKAGPLPALLLYTLIMSHAETVITCAVGLRSNEDE